MSYRWSYAVHPHMADILAGGNDAGPVELLRVQVILDLLRYVSASRQDIRNSLGGKSVPKTSLIAMGVVWRWVCGEAMGGCHSRRGCHCVKDDGVFSWRRGERILNSQKSDKSVLASHSWPSTIFCCSVSAVCWRLGLGTVGANGRCLQQIDSSISLAASQVA